MRLLAITMSYCSIYKHIWRKKYIRNVSSPPNSRTRRDERYRERCFKIFYCQSNRWSLKNFAIKWISSFVYFGPSGLEECRTVSNHVLDICESGVEGGESEAVIRVEKVKQCVFKRNELVRGIKRVTISKLIELWSKLRNSSRLYSYYDDRPFFSSH